MSYFCFICQCTVTKLEKLFIKLKVIHSLKSNSLYKCGFPDCNQHFSAFCSFSKCLKSDSHDFQPINSDPLMIND